ncbi:hypothetical protein Tco_0078473 [Tanacetum coccineum]|uniref:Reverse transcriptase/retrotransposon-derived protein RNase H-like domain-containing protein n=1 Tax=Tanacetum coccineum TaxID=301880 RepID=A0ABQ5J2X3_9ASTR
MTDLGDVLLDFKDLKKHASKNVTHCREIDWKVSFPLWVPISNVSLGMRNKGRNVFRYKVITKRVLWKACPDKQTRPQLAISRSIKDKVFNGTPEAERPSKQLKSLLLELYTYAPREREELIIYLAAAKEAISAVLMMDREGRQIPVYFVSRTL